jgi:hypothetical protein
MPNFFHRDNRDLGSLDAFACRGQMPARSSRAAAYDEIAKLSMQAESLKQENELLKLELLELVTGDPDDPYCGLKKSIIEFGIRLSHREREVEDVGKHLMSVAPSPTFVEVDVHRDRHASFDLVATSLLVSNDQRPFFNAADLRRQNEELLALIEHQEEGLQMIASRLQLYAQCQRKHSIRLRLDALRRGERPSVLVDTAPDQIREQRMKIRLLQRELRGLVEQRREISGLRRRAGRRVERKRRNEAALKIQRVWRGWRARRKFAGESAHPVVEPPPRELETEAETEPEVAPEEVEATPPEPEADAEPEAEVGAEAEPESAVETGTEEADVPVVEAGQSEAPAEGVQEEQQEERETPTPEDAGEAMMTLDKLE